MVPPSQSKSSPTTRISSISANPKCLIIDKHVGSSTSLTLISKWTTFLENYLPGLILSPADLIFSPPLTTTMQVSLYFPHPSLSTSSTLLSSNLLNRLLPVILLSYRHSSPCTKIFPSHSAPVLPIGRLRQESLCIKAVSMSPLMTPSAMPSLNGVTVTDPY